MNKTIKNAFWVRPHRAAEELGGTREPGVADRRTQEGLDFGDTEVGVYWLHESGANSDLFRLHRLEEDVRELELHGRWNAPDAPVVNPLNATSLQVEAEQLCNFGGATERVDERLICFVHRPILNDAFRLVNGLFK